MQPLTLQVCVCVLGGGVLEPPHSQVLLEPQLSPSGDRTGKAQPSTGKPDKLELLFTAKAREGYRGRGWKPVVGELSS